MAVVHTDLAQAVSTQFEVWFRERFNESVVATDQAISRLVMDIDLPDFQGNRINLNWLGAAPQLREWVDEKRAIGMGDYTWDIVVKRWEATLAVDLDAVSDARWNMYAPKVREMAQNASRHRYNLISDLVRLGEAALCYDGQNFFDTDHAEGDSGAQSNKLTGTGTSLAQITADFFSAKAALMQFKDDKGEPMWSGDFRPLVWAPANATIMQRFDTLRGAVPTQAGATDIPRLDFDVIYDPKQTDADNWVMFLPDSEMKPFVGVNREAMHYEDNYGTGHPDVWSRREGQASVVGRDNLTYAMWQKAVKVINGGS